MLQSNGEVSISTAELFGVDDLDDLLLAPLEAMAGILVQHGEVLAASYTLEAGRVIFMASDTLTEVPIEDSDVPDSIIPENFREKVNTNDSGPPCPNFVITTNSYEPTTQEVKTSNPHNLRIMEGGKDLWHKFKDHKY
jgi:hypothetical protein